MSRRKKSITIYTDGSCINEIGGWAFLAILNSDCVIYMSGSKQKTTNNRMELKAVIEAISFFGKKRRLSIYTDSQLIMNCATHIWNRKRNLDLWKNYDKISKDKIIKFFKVKAHSDDCCNNFVDSIARREVKNKKKFSK